MISCFCFYNENMPSTGCGTESPFLKNCGKQLDVYLFKCFGGRDEVAMGVERFAFHRVVPSGPVLLLEPSRAALRGIEFLMSWGNSYMSNYYSILPLRLPSSFGLVIGKGSKFFFWADSSVSYGWLPVWFGRLVCCLEGSASAVFPGYDGPPCISGSDLELRSVCTSNDTFFLEVIFSCLFAPWNRDVIFLPLHPCLEPLSTWGPGCDRLSWESD